MRRKGKLGMGLGLVWLGGMLFYVQTVKSQVTVAFRTAST